MPVVVPCAQAVYVIGPLADGSYREVDTMLEMTAPMPYPVPDTLQLQPGMEYWLRVYFWYSPSGALYQPAAHVDTVVTLNGHAVVPGSCRVADIQSYSPTAGATGVVVRSVGLNMPQTSDVPAGVINPFQLVVWAGKVVAVTWKVTAVAGAAGRPMALFNRAAAPVAPIAVESLKPATSPIGVPAGAPASVWTP